MLRGHTGGRSPIETPLARAAARLLAWVLAATIGCGGSEHGVASTTVGAHVEEGSSASSGTLPEESATIVEGGPNELRALAQRNVVALDLIRTEVGTDDLRAFSRLRSLGIAQTYYEQLGDDPGIDFGALKGLKSLERLVVDVEFHGYARLRAGEVLKRLSALEFLTSLRELTLRVDGKTTSEVYDALPHLGVQKLWVLGDASEADAIVDLQKVPKVRDLSLKGGAYAFAGARGSELTVLNLIDAEVLSPEALADGSLRELVVYGRGPVAISQARAGQLRAFSRLASLESLVVGNASGLDARFIVAETSGLRRLELECVDLSHGEALGSLGVCELSMVDVRCDGQRHCLAPLATRTCPEHCKGNCALRHIIDRGDACHAVFNGYAH